MENHCRFFIDWLLCRDMQVAGALISQMAPSVPLPPTGVAAPHHPRADHWGSCSMPTARTRWGCGTGMSLQMLQPGLGADGSGLRGCSATSGQRRRPAPYLRPPPPPLPHPSGLQLGTKPAAIIQAKHVNLADPAAPV